MQRRFFDHFLRGEQNGWEETPRVTLAVSRSREVCDVRGAPNWPLPEVHYRPLSLDAASGTLCADPPAHEGVMRYGPRGGARARARFVYRFERESELSGSMTLALWVATSAGDDLDLFVLLRTFDVSGSEICFYG